MKKLLHVGLKYMIIYVALIAIFIISLTLVSLIPSSSMKENVRISSEILNGQTNKWKIQNRYLIPTVYDNYTDALMVNTAYSIYNKKPLYSAMMAMKNYIPGKTETITRDKAGELQSSSKYKQLDQIGDLKDTVNEETTEAFEYARYWHGYLLWLRPLLVLTNITNIRIMLMVIFALLGIALCVIVAKKTKIIYGVMIRYSAYYV